MFYARVAIPVPLGQAFSYSVPPELEARVVPGARVACSFGRRQVLGVVLDVSREPPKVDPAKLKALLAVVDESPVVPEELLRCLLELARYYLAPIGEVLRLAVPALERGARAELEQGGLFAEAAVDSVGRWVLTVEATEAEPAQPLSGQALGIWEKLRADGPSALSSLEREFGNARSAARRLEKLGLAKIERQVQLRDPFAVSAAAPSERDQAPVLTSAQRSAVDAICRALTARERGAFLLDGVTASGKTEVYLHAVAHCLELGFSAIVIVPEIALTPQLVARFRARLGDAIAVLHSGLSESERYGMWKALRQGRLRVAIGARSALFAPLEQLGLICVDEEHDGSYKQEEGVRYHARDMALLRAHRAQAVCVLGSATPSLASESLVRQGKMTRLELPARAHQAAVLPKVEVIDLRRVGAGPSGNRWLSLPLHRALERVLEERQQAILFLNRRGFAPSVICEGCGKLVECPNCSVTLTLHKSGQRLLRCHYCDYAMTTPERCPACQAPALTLEGAGTEQVEEVLATSFPSARIGRLDRDVAAGLKSEKVLARMRTGELDILVGTQMVTKGHDLPNVTLVGVLNADSALSLPDFRAAERAFHLLVQVAGRAGRGDSPGRVLIQTRQPEHHAIAFAVRHDVSGFIERELKDRSEVGYPPFSRLALVRLDATEEGRAKATAEQLAGLARRHAAPGVEVLGPTAAPLARLRNRYRYRFMLRSRARAGLHPVLLAVLRAAIDRRVRLAIDVDPVSML